MSHAASASSARRFRLDDDEPSPGLTVTCGGVEYGASDDPSEAGDPAYVLEFVAHGQGTIVFADSPCRLAAGMVLVREPSTHGRVVFDPELPLVRYFVGFSGCEAAALLEEYGLRPGAALATQSPSRILDLFDKLVRTGCRGSAFRSRLAALMLEQLVLVVAETAVRSPRAGAAFDSYVRCRQHIEAHWDRLLTLEQLGDECGLDPAYVCRLFRRFDRQTPYQYLVRKKISHAARRLRDSETSVKQVAHDLGFTDPFHFSRVFRRVMGIPPGRYSQATAPKRPDATNKEDVELTRVPVASLVY